MAAVLPLLFLTSLAMAADCQVCAKKAAELADQQKQLDNNTEYLGKNRGYLAVLSASEASRFMKVSGNIELIMKQIDTIKERIKTLKSEMEKEGCQACPKANP